MTQLDPPGRRKGKSVWLGKASPDHLIEHQEVVRFPVRADTASMRLDRFLQMRLPWRSRESVHRLLAERDVRVSGAQRKAAYRLRAGEVVAVPNSPPTEDPAAMHSVELDILHEDDDLVVLNKQPNVVVHPAGRHRYGTLINALHLRYRRPDDPERDIQPKLGHRLDRETSGVLVVCKTDRARRSVQAQFEGGLVGKEYLCIVEGCPGSDHGRVDAPIGRSTDGVVSMQQAIRPDGLTAATRYEVVERLGRFALARALPETGRQHQIRVHMLHLGHPVLCDELYTGRHTFALSEVRPLGPGEEDRVLLERQALHSHRITLNHPATGEPLTLRAPMPEDMQAVVAALREASVGR